MGVACETVNYGLTKEKSFTTPEATRSRPRRTCS